MEGLRGQGLLMQSEGKQLLPGLMPHLPHSLAGKPGNSNFSWSLGGGVGVVRGAAMECWLHLHLSRPQGALLPSPTSWFLLILCQKVSQSPLEEASKASLSAPIAALQSPTAWVPFFADLPKACEHPGVF